MSKKLLLVAGIKGYYTLARANTGNFAKVNSDTISKIYSIASTLCLSPSLILSSSPAHLWKEIMTAKSLLVRNSLTILSRPTLESPSQELGSSYGYYVVF